MFFNPPTVTSLEQGHCFARHLSIYIFFNWLVTCNQIKPKINKVGTTLNEEKAIFIIIVTQGNSAVY